MEKIHKIYVSPVDIIKIAKSCLNEEYNKMRFDKYDQVVGEVVSKSENSTFFKMENDKGALVGFFSIKQGKLNQSYIRKTFRISSYISAINAVVKEEELLKTNASLSFSRNKILN